MLSIQRNPFSRNRLCALLVLLVSLTLAFAVGCGSSSKSNTSTTTTTTGNGTGTTGTNNGGTGTSSGSGGGTAGGTTASTVAYVGMNYSATQNVGGKIAAYSFASNGTATPVAGSPFTGGASLGLLPDATQKLLFGSDYGDITTYTIQGDGSLKQQTNLAAVFGSQLNRADSTLYPLQFYVGGTGSSAFAFMNINSDGSLTMTGSINVSVGGLPLYFTPDNTKAYEPYCYHLSASIVGYNRGSSGALTAFTTNAALPLDSAGEPACPMAMAVSPDGKYLVTGMNAVPGGSAGIGVYTINVDGTLTAVSGSPFPSSSASTTYNYAVFDPSGKFIAFAESDGVAIYRFNGAAAPVLMSGSPAGGASMDQVAFNQSGDLLFSVNNKAGNLYVFTFNNGTILPGPGSPIAPGFTFTGPNSLAVTH